MAVKTLLAADERQRLVAQNAEIAALAGGLAHEVRNPLSSISLNLDLLAEEVQGSQTPSEHRMLQKIRVVQRECQRLESILNAFLGFARLGEIEPVECDLNQAVRNFMEFYQPECAAASIEISPHLAPDLPPVRLDQALFRQALLNLALNARQAMPGGGLLELQTRARDGWVELDLIDNGCGMDESTLARIFDGFFSTKPAGSGLGLPTVRRIIEAHGGRITVESAIGRGTRFTISLLPADGSGP
ncbi:MAG: two-component sensor histidine kinase [Planctomycetaceae bacterium]|nr:two-component sensor histidine kinase [Planctomycetaceae bacterium]